VNIQDNIRNNENKLIDYTGLYN